MADECHFNPDKYHSTHWMKKNDRIRKVSRFSQHSPIVVCTVISVLKGLVHNQYGQFSFDHQDMMRVLEVLRAKAGRESKVCLFWDNARMHKSLSVQERARAEDVKIHLCNNVAYRPDLNPVEKVF